MAIMHKLLHDDAVVDQAALRAHARVQVYKSPLLTAAASGDREAARALLIGFWPFVFEFERAIDQMALALPMKPLMARYGRAEIRSYIRSANRAVRDMKEEEGSHAELWRRDSSRLAISDLGWTVTPGVHALIQGAYADDPSSFFCRLAATEYIAEELSRRLCAAEPFTRLFTNERFTWGEAHLQVHEGPSHLMIDEDLARAYHPSDDPSEVRSFMEAEIRRFEELFYNASVDVFAAAAPPTCAEYVIRFDSVMNSASVGSDDRAAPPEPELIAA